MEDNDRSRILNMVKDGKITIDEAEKLLDALEGRSQPADSVPLKDNRGRKPKKLRVMVDSGNSKDAKVNVNIPISLVRTVGPLVFKNMPKEAKEKLEESGVDLAAIFNDIEKLLEDGLEEDIVNIDSGENGDKSKVRIYVE
jgi:hypothetical protein